jgi:hypothetical protein
MSDTAGRRRNSPSDPSAERASDPLPTGEDVIEREQPGERPERSDEGRHETPRRYEQPVDRDPVYPSDDATLNTQI